MLALVQPFGLNSQGGGSRILSSLLQGKFDRFVSISTVPGRAPPVHSGMAAIEWHIPVRPAFECVGRTRLNPLLTPLDVALGPWLKRRLVAAFERCRATVVHVIPHSADFWPAYLAARHVGARVAVSMHDDLRYAQARSPVLPILERRLGRLWREADSLMVISDEMGEECNRRFGLRAYSVVTDGIERIADMPRRPSVKSLRVHFGGALHSSYRRNFEQLLLALERIKVMRPDWCITLSLRGSGLDLNSAGIAIRSLPWADQSVFENDLRESDLLYLPLPFEPEHLALSRFSLSTKMVTYLASGTPVVYHGPADAAAGRLLARHDAALCATVPSADALTPLLMVLPERALAVADAALRLATSQFALATQRERFWQAVGMPF